MSANLFKRVWAEYPEGGSTLVLMLAIGENADRNGHWTAPWSDVLTAARMSYSSAVRALEELRISGWIVYERVRRRRATLSIQLNSSKMGLADADSVTVAIGAEARNPPKNQRMASRKHLEPTSAVSQADVALERGELVDGKESEAVQENSLSAPPSLPDEPYLHSSPRLEASLRRSIDARQKAQSRYRW